VSSCVSLVVCSLLCACVCLLFVLITTPSSTANCFPINVTASLFFFCFLSIRVFVSFCSELLCSFDPPPSPLFHTYPDVRHPTLLLRLLPFTFFFFRWCHDSACHPTFFFLFSVSVSIYSLPAAQELALSGSTLDLQPTTRLTPSPLKVRVGGVLASPPWCGLYFSASVDVLRNPQTTTAVPLSLPPLVAVLLFFGGGECVCVCLSVRVSRSKDSCIVSHK
jgi:hypothetical protein